eukprot:Rmarinus@m.11559
MSFCDDRFGWGPTRDDSDFFELTPCFVDFLSLLPPCLFLLEVIILALFASSAERKTAPRFSSTHRHQCHVIICLLALFLLMANSVRNGGYDSDEEYSVSFAEVLSPASLFVAAAMAQWMFSLADANVLSRVHVSSSTFRLSLGIFCVNVIRLISWFIADDPKDVRLVLYFITLVCVSYHMRETLLWYKKLNAVHGYHLLEDNRDDCKNRQVEVDEDPDPALKYTYEYDGMVSRFLYLWMNPILKLGSQRPLELDDLGILPDLDKAGHVHSLLAGAWEKEVKANGKDASLWRAYIQAFWPWMFYSGCYIAISVPLAFVGPMGLAKLVTYIEDENDGVGHPKVENGVSLSDVLNNGYAMGLLITMSLYIQSMCFNNHHHTVMRTGLHVCVALQGIVYRKALKMPCFASDLAGDSGPEVEEDLSNIRESLRQSLRGSVSSMTGADGCEERNKDEEERARVDSVTGAAPEGSATSLGHIVSLMSTDATRVMFFFYFSHWSWVVVIQIVMCIVLLCITVGWAAPAGLAALFVLMPLNSRLAKRMGKFQKAKLVAADRRIKAINELLQGIKAIKFYAWEPAFLANIDKLRDKEMNELFGMYLSRFATITVMVCTPIILTLLTLVSYTWIYDDPLDAQTAFTTLALINTLKVPFIVMSLFVVNFVEARVSTQRLKEFLLLPELPLLGTSLPVAEQRKYAISLRGNFSWGQTVGPADLQDISLQLAPGTLTIVIGPVGSGKSSLLMATLGEMLGISGCDRHIGGSLSFAAQSPWLRNATVRENILFGRPMDQKYYNRVVEACCLLQDFEALPAGDATEVGDRGITLSGGQKQRISVARLVYSRAQVCLLDDPISALDAHVGPKLFNEALLGILIKEGRTVVLSTHNVSVVPQADHVVVLEKGRIKAQGAFDAIRQHVSHLDEPADQDLPSSGVSNPSGDPKADATSVAAGSELETPGTAGTAGTPGTPGTAGPLGVLQKATEASVEGKSGRASASASIASEKSVSAKNSASDKNAHDGRLTEDEERAEGAVELKVYKSYALNAGKHMIVLTLTMVMLARLALIAIDFWLAHWMGEEEDAEDEPDDDDSAKSTSYYASIYSILVAVGFTLVGFHGVSFSVSAFRAARALHHKTLSTVAHLPMAFFDATPIGRILNRFSSDTDVVDQRLPDTSNNLMNHLMTVISVCLVVCLSLPQIIPVITVVMLGYYWLQGYFRSTARELQRVEKISRSPIYVHFSESLAGLSTIRAYGLQDAFISEGEGVMNRNSLAYLFLNGANRWLSVRLDVLVCSIVLSTSLGCIALADTLDAGSGAMAITYSLLISNSMIWLVRMLADTEMQMGSVERLNHYAGLDKEESTTTPSQVVVPPTWPSRGEIEFVDVEIRYRPNLAPAVRGLNVRLPGGSRVGICGRTGGGKSSTTLSLFRMVPMPKGRILIDGLDIASVPLHVLRERLAIIPQDPVLFAGSVRYNLDPTHLFTDDEVWHALEVAQLSEVLRVRGRDGLASQVEEGGSNFSQGQRQLFCLARAVLRNAQILVMDEATASVDLETDSIVQEAIRRVFKGKTVLTIAHRVTTILDYDYAMGFADGRMVEFGPPNAVLGKMGFI